MAGNQRFFLDKVMNIAHRGGSGLYPQNTLYAFTRVIKETGADAIEMDVWASRDGHLVVHHDVQVSKTTNGQGRINKLTLAEIKQLDAAYNFTVDGSTYPLRGRGITIPTLSEVIRALPNTRLNLDIKQAHPPVEEGLYNLIVKNGRPELFLVASQYEQVTRRFAALNQAGIATAASPWQVFNFYLKTQLGLGRQISRQADAFEVATHIGQFNLMTQRFIDAAHRHRIAVIPWIINDQDVMRQLINLGVDGVITDYPNRLRDVLADN